MLIFHSAIQRIHVIEGFVLYFEGNAQRFQALLSKNGTYYENTNHLCTAERGKHKKQQARVITECETLFRRFD